MPAEDLDGRRVLREGEKKLDAVSGPEVRDPKEEIDSELYNALFPANIHWWDHALQAFNTGIFTDRFEKALITDKDLRRRMVLVLTVRQNAIEHFKSLSMK